MSQSAPIVLDPAAQAIEDMLVSIDWSKVARDAARETASRAYLQRPPARRELRGAEAADYLQGQLAIVQSEALRQHAGYGAVRWLWYLRRAPDTIFQGSYFSTLGHDRLLAECLSAPFTTEDRSEHSECVSFRVDVAAVRHLSRYVGHVKLLSQLQILYRRIGKGALLDARDPLLGSTNDDATERAIEVYDERHDRSHEFVGAGLGLVSIDPDFNKLAGETWDEPVAFLAVRCTGFKAQFGYPTADGSLVPAILHVNYVLKALKLSRILGPMGHGDRPPMYFHNVAALIQLLMLVPALQTYAYWALSSTVQLGYFFIAEDRLRHLLDHRLPAYMKKLDAPYSSFEWPVGYENWLKSMHTVKATIWPLLAGDVLRKFGSNVLIDISGASHALLQRLEMDRTPLIGNLRARAFELQCQDVIDSTPWKPAPELRALRGRTLRRSGAAVTDVDAIGMMGQVLLLASCKSLIYDREYDRGSFRVIRNTQHTVDAAVREWVSIVEDLRRHPSGDNFNFSAFKEIVGVVCTPFAAYSDAGPTLDFVKPGLRAASSILELRDWLQASDGCPTTAG